MPRVRAPRRGSMAFSPRVRARSINGRIRFWPEVDGAPRLLGFAGYKAGMAHVFVTEDRERSPDFGKEVASPITVIDTPPMLACSLRAYKKTVDGLKVLSEVWMADPPADLRRRVKPLTPSKPEEAIGRIESSLDRVVEVRVVLAMQPRLTSVPKKRPELLEVKVGGGSAAEMLEYAKGLLGKTVRASEVFKAGESVDIIGVTKGKGFQGPVKRWGVRILQNKSRKTKRGVGTLGPWHPARVMPGVPRAGQMGFHNRTEFKKRILAIGEEGGHVTPAGGFNRYGVVRGDFVVVKGSVAGPAKRLLRLRRAVRVPRYPAEAPKVDLSSIRASAGGGGPK